MKKYFIIGGVAIVLFLAATMAFSTSIFVKFPGSDTVYKAYQTAEQFFADGGAKDFSNIALMEQNFGSVSMASEYHSTSTAPNAGGNLNATTPTLLQTGPGALGSIIVLKAGTAGGRYNLYNATTTDITKRNNVATSSVIITSLPTDLAAGTYTFDVVFYTGLIVDWTGTIGTSTITFR